MEDRTLRSVLLILLLFFKRASNKLLQCHYCHVHLELLLALVKGACLHHYHGHGIFKIPHVK